jgi:hypothetical protein
MNQRLALLFALTVSVTQVTAQGETSAATKLHSMEWLLGTWNRTNSKPGRSGIESWTKQTEMKWVGRGVTMKATDTAFVEKISIVIEKGKLFYVADVPENKSVVYFEITSVSKDGFVCENPSHDFPKKIEYKVTGSTLNARISGGDKFIDYVFERK